MLNQLVKVSLLEVVCEAVFHFFGPCIGGLR